MKRILIVMWMCMLLLSISQLAAAQNFKGPTKGSFGIGAIFGEPTGITLKWWLTRDVAMDATAAWSFADDSAFQLHVDYLVHQFDLIKVQKGKLPIYIGFGGRVKFSDDTKVGIRIPLGMSYFLDTQPLELFGEIVPSLDIAPSTKAVLMGGVGVRYYFK